MKKNVFYISALAVALCFGSTAFTSCSDPDDIQDLVLDRVLSPTGITARITNNTDIVVDWNEMTGATAYEIEAYADNNDYDNNTPAVKTTTTSNTCTLTSLIGETDYYIRVRALDENNENRNSKWVEIMKTTNPEQNMNKVKSGDIQSKAVKLTWLAGLQVDKIICTPSSAGSTAEKVTYTLTADDIAAGSALVSGLDPETTYKVTLKLGEKTRGYATFTTNIDFSDATVITPSDDWVSAIQNAAPGSKIALAPGTYELSGTNLVISNSVKIGAQNSASLPILNANIHLTNEASLMLYQVILDGTGNSNSAIEFKGAGSYSELTLKGCEIRNFENKSFIYNNVAAVIDNITIDNCLIHHMDTNNGQDFIDSRKGGWNSLNVTNSTFYECAPKRQIFRGDDASSSVNAKMETYVDKCTFYNVGNGGSNHMFFYIRFKGNTNTFTNNVVANFINKRGFSNTSALGTPTYSNNYYYNCLNMLEQDPNNTETGLTAFDKEGKVLDANPFKDPSNGDFIITDEILQTYQFGDPRWY